MMLFRQAIFFCIEIVTFEQIQILDGTNKSGHVYAEECLLLPAREYA